MGVCGNISRVVNAVRGGCGSTVECIYILCVCVRHTCCDPGI